MSRTHRLLAGFAAGYAHLIVATAAGLWLTPFFLGELGQGTYGLWLVGTQLIAYLLLMDVGVVALLPREAAYVTGRTGTVDDPELRLLVEKALTLACVQTPLVMVAAMIGLWLVPNSWALLRAPLAVVLLVFVLTFPLRVFAAALTGLQDLSFVARTQFLAWLAGTFVNVALVWQGFGLPALAGGWCITQLAITGASAARLAWRFPAAMPRRLAWDRARTAGEYIRRSLWVSVGQVAQVLLNGTDVMIVGALLGPAAVVPYACTGKLISVLANQPQALLQTAAPALSELRTSAEYRRLFTVTAALTQATLAISGLVACVVLAVNAGFVRWWVGPEQFGGWNLTVLLLTAMIIRHFNTTNVYALFCFGHERRLALTALADGVVTLALSALLVKSVGLAGAPLGAIAGVVLVSAPANLSALARETGVARLQLVRALHPWLWRFLLVTALAGAAGAWLQPVSFVLLALLGGAATFAYVATVVGPLLESPAGAYLRPLLDRLAAALPGFLVQRRNRLSTHS